MRGSVYRVHRIAWHMRDIAKSRSNWGCFLNLSLKLDPCSRWKDAHDTSGNSLEPSCISRMNPFSLSLGKLPSPSDERLSIPSARHCKPRATVPSFLLRSFEERQGISGWRDTILLA